MATKLSALLVQDRVVSFRQMDAAVQRQQQYGGRIGTNLLELGHVDEGILLYYISKQRHMPALDNQAFAEVDPEALDAWDVDTATELLAVPLDVEDNRMRVAVTEPLPDAFVSSFEEMSGLEMEQLLTLEFRIQQALNAFHQVPIPDRFVPLIERLPIPMGTTDGAIATTGTHVHLGSRHLPSGLHQITPVFDAEGDEIPGLTWTGQQLAAFFETSVSRDHILLTALGFAGKFFSRRMLFLVSKRGLRGYALQMPGEPDRPIDRAETPVTEDSAIGRLIAGESYFLGALEHTGLAPLYDQLGLAHPPDVCVIPVKVGPRAALLLVGDAGEERIDARALPIIFLAVNRLASGLERLIRRLKSRRSAGHSLARAVDSPLDERSHTVRQKSQRLSTIVNAQRQKLISAASKAVQPGQEDLNRLPEDGWDFDDGASGSADMTDTSGADDGQNSLEQAGQREHDSNASFSVDPTGTPRKIGIDGEEERDPDHSDRAVRPNPNDTIRGFSAPPIKNVEEDDWVREPTDRFSPIEGSPRTPQGDDAKAAEDDGTTSLSGIVGTETMVGLLDHEGDDEPAELPTDDGATPFGGDVINPMADSTLSLVPDKALTPFYTEADSNAEPHRGTGRDEDTPDTAAVNGETSRISHQLDTSNFGSAVKYEDQINDGGSLFGLRRREEDTGQKLAIGVRGRQNPIDLDVRLPGVLQPPRLRDPESKEDIAFANEILNAHNAQLVEWLTSEDALRSDAAFMTLLDRGQAAHDELIEVFPGPLTVDRRAPWSVMEPKPLERHGPVVWLIALQLRSVQVRLRDVTKSDNPDARYYAARLLDQAADAGAIERMADLLFDTDSQVRDTALSFIEKHLRKRDRHLHPVLPSIRARLSSDEPWVVDVAITTANRLRDRGAVPELLGALSAQSTHTRQKAAQALSMLTFQDFGLNARRWQKWHRRNGSSTRSEWLLDAMVSREWKIRDNAARELRTLQGLIVNYSPDFEKKQLDAARRTVHRHLFGRDGGPN